MRPQRIVETQQANRYFASARHACQHRSGLPGGILNAAIREQVGEQSRDHWVDLTGNWRAALGFSPAVFTMSS